MIGRALIVVAIVCGCARPPPVAKVTSRTPASSELTMMRAVRYDGRKYAALRLRFVGNARASAPELARVLTITHGLVDRELLEHDELMLAAFYCDRGFLDVHINTSATASGEVITVTFAIDEGDPYRVRSITAYEEVDGKRVTPLGWSARFQPGEIFRRATFNESVMAVRRAYLDLGYAYVDAAPEVQQDKQTHELSITLPVRRGVVTYIGRIEIVGAKKLALDVITAELLVKVGDRYNETALEQTKQRLIDSAWFSRVDISTKAGSAKDLIDVSIEVDERATTSHGEVASIE